MKYHHIEFLRSFSDSDPSAASARIDKALDALSSPRSIHAVRVHDENAPSLIAEPIILDRTVDTLAHLDTTGASHSVIRESIFLTLSGSKVSLAGENVSVPHLGSARMPFSCMGRELQHRFDVLCSLLSVDVILGRDILSLLGITISGLPLPDTPAQEPVVEDEVE